MVARDQFHDVVKEALIREGWTITDDPLFVGFDGLDMYVDLGAERLIAAEKGNQQIAVEIKSFLGPSVISEFHTALGQFLNYRLALKSEQPQRTVHLAVPLETYNVFVMVPFYQIAIKEHSVPLIVYDPDSEAILQWIP